MPTAVKFGQLINGILSDNSVNTYTFDTQTGGEVRLQFDYDQRAYSWVSLKIQLTDASGRQILSKTITDDRTWDTVIQQSGTYTLSVSDHYGSIPAAGLAYTVDTAFSTEANVVYERPLHKTAATAMSIVTGRPVVGALQSNELDFYKISAQQAGQLHLSFSHPAGPGKDGAGIKTQIIDSATGKVLNDLTLKGSELITTNIEGGSYLLRISDNPQGDRGIYSFIATTSNKTGNDFLNGTGANEVFKSSSGNDTFAGNGGFDIVQYDRAAADYRLAFSDAGVMVEATAGTGGRDALFNISRIKFADKTIDLGDMTDAAMLYRLYDAAFDRMPDEAGLGFWLNALEDGVSPHQVAHGFVDSAEFRARYSTSLSNQELVTGFYHNILNRAPDAGGLAFWTGALDAGADIAVVLEGFSESAEHQAMLVGQLTHGVSYIPYGG